jgi:hypothetical protein
LKHTISTDITSGETVPGMKGGMKENGESEFKYDIFDILQELL